MPSGSVVSSESDTERVDRDRSDGEMNVEPVDAERCPFSPMVARRWARVPGSKAFDAPLHCLPFKRRRMHLLVECWLAPSWRRSGSSEYHCTASTRSPNSGRVSVVRVPPSTVTYSKVFGKSSSPVWKSIIYGAFAENDLMKNYRVHPTDG